MFRDFRDCTRATVSPQAKTAVHSASGLYRFSRRPNALRTSLSSPSIPVDAATRSASGPWKTDGEERAPKDVIGKRGENIVELCLTEYATFPAPLFDQRAKIDPCKTARARSRTLARSPGGCHNRRSPLFQSQPLKEHFLPRFQTLYPEIPHLAFASAERPKPAIL